MYYNANMLKAVLKKDRLLQNFRDHEIIKKFLTLKYICLHQIASNYQRIDSWVFHKFSQSKLPYIAVSVVFKPALVFQNEFIDERSHSPFSLSGIFYRKFRYKQSILPQISFINIYLSYCFNYYTHHIITHCY